jgi:hypothetical protein
MTRKLATLLVALTVLSAANAVAQDSAPRQPALEVSLVPAGGTFFREGSDTKETSFTNYDFSGVLTLNLNRYFGVEGEVGTSRGIRQNLTLAGGRQDLNSPNLLHHTANLVVYTPLGRTLAPFIIAGVGGVTIFDRAELFIPETRTYLSGNVGGGLKWYGGRWGIRADYRFLIVRSEPFVPDPNVRARAPFFGRETRYGHRIFGGVILKLA